jgi:hypothetical protein
VVHRVQDVIDANLASALRISDLAYGAGPEFAKPGTARPIHPPLGPQSYVQLRRIETALRLLETTDSAIDTIRARSVIATRHRFDGCFVTTPDSHQVNTATAAAGHDRG